MTLERDPDKIRAWQRRSAARARSTGWQSPDRRRASASAARDEGAKTGNRSTVRPRSERTQAEAPGRAVIRDTVFRRDGRCLLSDVDGHRCSGARLTPHHLLKAGRGGGYTVDNLVTLCAGGNTWVEDHPTDAARLGLVVGWVRAEGRYVDHDEAARRRRSAGMR